MSAFKKKNPKCIHRVDKVLSQWIKLIAAITAKLLIGFMMKRRNILKVLFIRLLRYHNALTATCLEWRERLIAGDVAAHERGFPQWTLTKSEGQNLTSLSDILMYNDGWQKRERRPWGKHFPPLFNKLLWHAVMWRLTVKVFFRTSKRMISSGEPYGKSEEQIYIFQKSWVRIGCLLLSPKIRRS